MNFTKKERSNMGKINFELIDSNIGTVYRAKVFGGWLLISEMILNNSVGYVNPTLLVTVHQSAVFVPDDEYKWEDDHKLEDEQNEQ